MKKNYILILGFIFATAANAQRTYETIIDSDNTSKIFKGLISKEVLTCEESFSWYKANEVPYKPNAEAVQAIKDNGHKIKILAFGGTWCGDTRAILPKFYQLITAGGFLQADLSLYGVDRAKTTLGDLTKKWNIVNVPTFIVLKDGVEVGRVIEYGKTGLWDKDLGEIIKSVK